MRKLWKTISACWHALLALGALVGIIFLPQDIGDLPEALKKWQPIVAPITRERALIIFSSICLAWVVWIDIRPFVRAWRTQTTGRHINEGTKRSESLKKYVERREKFTLAEAACLIAGDEMREDDIVGPASGYLRDIKQLILAGEINTLNAEQYELSFARLNIPIEHRKEIRNSLEISRETLTWLAQKYEVHIPGVAVVAATNIPS